MKVCEGCEVCEGYGGAIFHKGSQKTMNFTVPYILHKASRRFTKEGRFGLIFQRASS